MGIGQEIAPEQSYLRVQCQRVVIGNQSFTLRVIWLFIIDSSAIIRVFSLFNNTPVVRVLRFYAFPLL